MRLGSTRKDLRAEIDACGYFPELVEDAIMIALAEEDLLDFVVHHEPTFNHDEIHRHVTVLALTRTRLIVGHTDDQPAEPPAPGIYAASSTESVALSKINTVALTRVVTQPEAYRAGSEDIYETWLAVGWGAVRRIDLEQATCSRPAVRGRPRLHRGAGRRRPHRADERRRRRGRPGRPAGPLRDLAAAARGRGMSVPRASVAARTVLPGCRAVAGPPGVRLGQPGRPDAEHRRTPRRPGLRRRRARAAGRRPLRGRPGRRAGLEPAPPRRPRRAVPGLAARRRATDHRRACRAPR